MLGDLEAELAEYDARHDATLIEATGIEHLPIALIRARIACDLTQRQLAERIGLQEQAIQRYEAADYFGVSFAQLVEIANAHETSVDYVIRLNQGRAISGRSCNQRWDDHVTSDGRIA
jgi:HTH-type transcriptional regulator/antitoxin HipB